MKSITINSNTYRYPENWQELGVKGIYAYANLIKPNIDRIFVSEEEVNTDLYRQIVSLVFGEVTGMSDKEWLAVRIDQWAQLFMEDVLKFMFTTPPFILRLPVQELHVGLEKWVAPGDGFENLCAEEFHFTDMYFQKYYDTDEIKWLHWLVATLYRPKTLENWKQTNDKRELFNRHTIDDRYEFAQRVSKTDLQIIAVWYQSCRSLLAKICPSLFDGDGAKADPTQGWINVIWSLARHNQAFGDIETIKHKNLIEILINLQDMAVEAERLEAQMNK